MAREGLETGSVWDEERVGTNGIGTCLVSRQPITVFGGAHFFEGFANFTCSAAPIFAPDGSVVGAFDISGRAIPGSGDSHFAQYFAREAAAQISTILFRRWHRNDCIVALSAEPDPMPMSVKALIATDESAGFSARRRKPLPISASPIFREIRDRFVHDVWNVSFNDLRPLSKHSVRLRGADGTQTFVTAFLPKKKSPSSTPRAVRTLTGSDEKKTPRLPAILARPLDRVAGADPQMIQNVGLCRRIIDKDIPLLILGETGVGKDTLARAIHLESKRAEKSYVAVNCAAIPATLLASELFGYAPGTFTGGAKGGRMGKILASQGGTLFLDEIGDMPLELQAHLLRVLEERTVTPLGSAETIPVDMKIICATHRNLPDLISTGEFRKDLYYRIRGAQIVLPCLRERGDIRELVELIVKDELGAEADKISFTDGVMDLFRRYPWPGNIRELRNVLRFITSLHSGRLVDIEDLPDQLLDFSRMNGQAATGDFAKAADASGIDEKRDSAARDDAARSQRKGREAPDRRSAANQQVERHGRREPARHQPRDAAPENPPLRDHLAQQSDLKQQSRKTRITLRPPFRSGTGRVRARSLRHRRSLCRAPRPASHAARARCAARSRSLRKTH